MAAAAEHPFPITLLGRLRAHARARVARPRRPHLAGLPDAVDAGGERVTAFLGPDRPARFVRPGVATNHQDVGGWPGQARATRSVERAELVLGLLAGPGAGKEELVAAPLRPPLFASGRHTAQVGGVAA